MDILITVLFVLAGIPLLILVHYLTGGFKRKPWYLRDKK